MATGLMLEAESLGVCLRTESRLTEDWDSVLCLLVDECDEVLVRASRVVREEMVERRREEGYSVSVLRSQRSHIFH